MFVLYFDMCAILLIVIMFFSNRIRGLTKGRTNILFSVHMVFVFIAGLADLGSGYGSNYYEATETNKNLMYFYNYVYFLTHNNIPLIYTLYGLSSMGVWSVVKNSKTIKALIIIPTFITNAVLLTNFFSNKVFHIDDGMNYCRGPWINILYISTFIFCIVSTCLFIKFRKFVDKDKFIALVTMLPLNLLAVLVQFFYSNLLIEMFIISVFTTIFVLVVQRQEETVDPVSGAKKYNAGVLNLKRTMLTNTPVTIILVKMVNNVNIRLYLGQVMFNEFLRNVTSTMTETAKSCGLNAEVYYLEYGLFALLSENPSDDLVTATADTLSGIYRDNIKIEESDIYCDARICVVKCPEDIDEYTTLIRFGITYHQSLPITNDVLYYSDFADDREFIIKNELDDIIARGLKNNSFEMYYQPIYSTEKKKFVAAEALIRLNDTVYGNISPGLFIPAAEISGDIHIIGDYVLDSVCRFIGECKPQKYGIENIQVNLSASQCVEIDLVDKVEKAVEKYHIDPENLNFEITESAADIDPVAVDKNVKMLYKKGIHFALDDYGTGYSNIKRVTGLPIDMVKLDKKFIENIDDSKMKIIIEDTILMLKAIDKKVLVEGIENEDMAKHFEDLGCDYIQGCEYMQGFFFCKPLPEKEFMEFMEYHH